MPSNLRVCPRCGTPATVAAMKLDAAVLRPCGHTVLPGIVMSRD